MLLQVALRLVLYTDQAIVMGDSIGVATSLSADRYGIDSIVSVEISKMLNVY